MFQNLGNHLMLGNEGNDAEATSTIAFQRLCLILRSIFRPVDIGVSCEPAAAGKGQVRARGQGQSQLHNDKAVAKFVPSAAI